MSLFEEAAYMGLQKGLQYGYKTIKDAWWTDPDERIRKYLQGDDSVKLTDEDFNLINRSASLRAAVEKRAGLQPSVPKTAFEKYGGGDLKRAGSWLKNYASLTNEGQAQQKYDSLKTQLQQAPILEKPGIIKSMVTNYLAAQGHDMVPGAKSLAYETLKIAPTFGRSVTEMFGIDDSIGRNYHSWAMDEINRINKKEQDLKQQGSETKAGFALGSGFASMAGGLGASFAARSLFVAGATMGLMDSADTYNQARSAGASPVKAFGLTAVKTVVTSALEELPLEFIKNMKPRLSLFSASAAAAEGIQEGTQTWVQNFIDKYGFDPHKKLMEGLGESILVGGIVGGHTAGIHISTAKVHEFVTNERNIREVQEAFDVSKQYARKFLKQYGNTLAKKAEEFNTHFKAGLTQASKELEKSDTSLGMFGGSEGRRLYNAGAAFWSGFFGEKRVIGNQEDEWIVNPNHFGMKLEDRTFYHGTSQDFEVFDKAKLGEYTGAGDAKIGFHFTDNKEVADLFGIPEKTKAVKLDIKKPFDLWKDFVGTEDNAKIAELYEIVTGNKAPEPSADEWDDIQTSITDGLSFKTSEFKNEFTKPEVVARLRARGYDAMILPLTESDQLMAGAQGKNPKGNEVIVFEPEQIKIQKAKKTELEKIKEVSYSDGKQRIFVVSPTNGTNDETGATDNGSTPEVPTGESGRLSGDDRETPGGGGEAGRTGGELLAEPEQRPGSHLKRLTPKLQREMNEAARKIILNKSLDELTADDLLILRQYAGAGGLEKAGEAGRGLLDEYYTPRPVIDKMWELLTKHGASGGEILEPSVGIGRFFENTPKWAKKLTGVEIDPISAKIAEALHPDAEIMQRPFEHFFVDPFSLKKKPEIEKYYNVIIGNPPYGSHRGKYRYADSPEIVRYEEYFIKRGLDLLRPGGLLAYVIPSTFLQGPTSKGKTAISGTGVLVDAYRLPAGIFGTTDIGTDIVIFQKLIVRKEQFGERSKLISNNTFFDQHPEKILGTKVVKKGRRGEPMIVVQGDLSNLDAIDTAKEGFVPRVNMKKLNYALKFAKGKEDAIKRIREKYPLVYPVKYPVSNYNKETGEWKNNEDITVNSDEELITEMIKNFQKRDEIFGMDTTRKHQLQDEEVYKAWKEWKQDEKKQNEKIQEEVKGKQREELIIKGQKELADASKYAKPMSELEERIWKARHWDGSVEDPNIPKESLNYSNGKWYSDWDYYSGNIYQRLDQAERDKKNSGAERGDIIRRQIERLKEILPPRKGVNEIYFSVIDPSLSKIVDQYDNSVPDLFVHWLEKLPLEAFEGGSQWEIRGYVNQTPVRGWDEDKVEAEKRRRRLVGEKLFQQFYKTELNPEMRTKLEDAFNRKFNGTVTPDYDKMPFYAKGLSSTFEGSPLTIRKAQLDLIAFFKQRGVGIGALDVGYGKTIAAIVAMMEMMQAGWMRKPVLIVPNGVYDKWISETLECYPDAKIVGYGNLGAQIKVGKGIEAKDGDISIMSHEALTKIRFREETEKDLVKDLRDVMLDLNAKKTKRGGEKDDDGLIQTIGRVSVGAEYYWEDFGFDGVIVDELHNFKNIFTTARSARAVQRKNKEEGTDNEGGSEIIEYRSLQGTSSARGVKMFLISQYILKHNHGRNFFGLTATPFSNSPIEVYSILSLVARPRLIELGIRNINDFVSVFMEMKEKDVIKQGGDIGIAMVVENFQNLQALQDLIRQYIDFKSGDDAPEIAAKRPERLIKEYKLSPTQEQINFMLDAEKIADIPPKDKGGILPAITEMRKITLSTYLSRFYDGPAPTAKEFVENSPKINLAMRFIAENKKQGSGSGQVIFMPLGVEYLPLVKEYLVKHVGFDNSEVAIISGDLKHKEKERVKKGFNDGSIKVVIGTEAIKEGIGLQVNATDMYILSYPWKPTDLVQLHGRIWRQGNQWAKVRVHNLSLADTIDSFMSQKLAEKTKRIQNIWSYRGNVLPSDELDFDEAKFELIRDPIRRVAIEERFERAELTTKIRGLKATIAMLQRLLQLHTRAKANVKQYSDDVVRYKKKIEEGFDAAKDWLVSARKSLSKAKADLKHIENDNNFKIAVPRLEELTKQLATAEHENSVIEEKYKVKKEAAAASGGVNWVSKPNDYGAYTKILREENLAGFFAKKKKVKIVEVEPLPKEEARTGTVEEVSPVVAAPAPATEAPAVDEETAVEITEEEETAAAAVAPEAEPIKEAETVPVEEKTPEEEVVKPEKRDPRLVTKRKVAKQKPVEEAAAAEEPKQGEDRNPLLAPELRTTEAGVRAYLESELAKQWDAENEGVAYLIDPDAIMKSFPDYDNNASVLHKASSELAWKLYEQAVTQDTTGIVKFSAGGSGSGKSEVVIKSLEDKPGVIYDGTFSKLDKDIRMIEIALAHGKKVEVHAVFTPFPDAFDFVQSRTDRQIDDEIPINTHYGYRQAMMPLAEKYVDNPDVKFIHYANSKALGFRNHIRSEIPTKDFILLAQKEKELYNKDDLTKIANDYHRQHRTGLSGSAETGTGQRGGGDAAGDGFRGGDEKSVGGERGQQRMEKGGRRGEENEGGSLVPYVVDPITGEVTDAPLLPEIKYESDTTPEDLRKQTDAYEKAKKERATAARKANEQEVFDNLPAAVQQMYPEGERPGHLDMRRRDINIVEEILGQSRDLFLKDENEFRAAATFEKAGDTRRERRQELSEQFAGLIKPYFQLKDRSKVEKALVQGDKFHKHHSDLELKGMGLNAGEVEAYKGLRAAFDKALDIICEKMEEAGTKKSLIKEFKGRMKGYLPHKWKYKHVIKKQEWDTKDEAWHTVTMDDYKTKKEQEAEFAKVSQTPSDKVRYIMDDLASLDVDFFQEQSISYEKVLSAVEQASAPEEMKQIFTIALINAFKEKGFGQHFIKRGNVQGYDTEDLGQNIADYFSGFAGFISKMESTPAYFAALKDIDARRQKRFHKWMRHAVAYDLGNNAEWDQVKKAAFIYFLANDVSFLLTNATQNLIVGTAELAKYTKGLNPEIEIIKAIVEWNTGKVSAEEKAAAEGFLKIGRLGGEMSAELMGFKNNPVYQEISSKLSKIMYGSTAYVETNINRVPMFIAARRVLAKTGLTGEELDRKALELSDNVHFRYGKHHRPDYQRGRKGTLFVFTHYLRSLLWYQARLLKKREWRSLVHMMGWTYVLGGAVALPAAGLVTGTVMLIIKEIEQAMGWDDDDDDKKEEEKQGWLSTMLQFGLPAALGVDISGKVSMNILSLEKILQDPLRVTNYLGAGLGGLTERAISATDLAEQHRFYESLAKIMPDALGNPIKAFYGYKYGIFSKAGKPLTDEQDIPMTYSLTEAIIKGAGFSPTRESQLWERNSKKFSDEERKNAISSKYRARIREALVRGDIEKAESIEKDAADMGNINPENSYIRDWVKEQMGVTDVLSAKGIKRFQEETTQEERELYLDHSSDKHQGELEQWLYAYDHPLQTNSAKERDIALSDYATWYADTFQKKPDKTTAQIGLYKMEKMWHEANGTTPAGALRDFLKAGGLQKARVQYKGLSADQTITSILRKNYESKRLSLDDVKEFLELTKHANPDKILDAVKMSRQEFEGFMKAK